MSSFNSTPGKKTINILGISTNLIPPSVDKEKKIPTAQVHEPDLLLDDDYIQLPTSSITERNSSPHIPFTAKIMPQKVNWDYEPLSTNSDDTDEELEPLEEETPMVLPITHELSELDLKICAVNWVEVSSDQDTVKLPSAADSQKSISNFAVMVKDLAREQGYYEKLQGDLKNISTFRDQFYDFIKPSVYKSLVTMLKIQQSGPQVALPILTKDTPYLSTWRFFESIHIMPSIQAAPASEKITVYRSFFGDNSGIDYDWKDYLYTQIKERTLLTDIGCRRLTALITDVWCAAPQAKVLPTLEEKKESKLSILPTAIKYEDDDSPEVVVNIIDHPSGIDTIQVIDCMGNEINFYDDLDSIDLNIGPEDRSQVNGIWDWLKHISPSGLIKTDEHSPLPLDILHELEFDEPMRFIEMAWDKEKGGIIWGVYRINEGLLEDNDIIRKINYLFRENITAKTSQLSRTLLDDTLYSTDKEMKDIIAKLKAYLDSDDETDADEDEDEEIIPESPPNRFADISVQVARDYAQEKGKPEVTNVREFTPFKNERGKLKDIIERE